MWLLQASELHKGGLMSINVPQQRKDHNDEIVAAQGEAMPTPPVEETLASLRVQVIPSLAAVALAFITGPWPIDPDALGGPGPKRW